MLDCLSGSRRAQEKLVAFAEFLGEREPGAVDEPLPLPRPAGETVTLAIRRLVQTYPMLDRRKLMGEAAQFMAQHALERRPAREVIDDLEAVFARHYQQRGKGKGERGKEE